MEQGKETDTTARRHELDSDISSQEAREALRTEAAAMAGPAAAVGEVELGSYDYFKDNYPKMDWTPESTL